MATIGSATSVQTTLPVDNKIEDAKAQKLAALEAEAQANQVSGTSEEVPAGAIKA